MCAISRTLLALLLVPLAGMAGAPEPAAALCPAAIQTAQLGASIPNHLLSAIAIVETGRPAGPNGSLVPWPWTINAEGAGQFFDTKTQAIAATEALLARGVRSIDVGCMQINLMHHPNAFASLDLAFDPIANVAYGALFLKQLHDQTGSWAEAAGAYHSETPEIAAPYRRRVLAAWGIPETTLRPASVPTVYAAFQRDALNYRALPPTDLVYRAFAPQEQVYAAFSPTQTCVAPAVRTRSTHASPPSGSPLPGARAMCIKPNAPASAAADRVRRVQALLGSSNSSP